MFGFTCYLEDDNKVNIRGVSEQQKALILSSSVFQSVLHEEYSCKVPAKVAVAVVEVQAAAPAVYATEAKITAPVATPYTTTPLLSSHARVVVATATATPSAIDPVHYIRTHWSFLQKHGWRIKEDEASLIIQTPGISREKAEEILLALNEMDKENRSAFEITYSAERGDLFVVHINSSKVKNIFAKPIAYLKPQFQFHPSAAMPAAAIAPAAPPLTRIMPSAHVAAITASFLPEVKPPSEADFKNDEDNVAAVKIFFQNIFRGISWESEIRYDAPAVHDAQYCLFRDFDKLNEETPARTLLIEILRNANSLGGQFVSEAMDLSPAQQAAIKKIIREKIERESNWTRDSERAFDIQESEMYPGKFRVVVNLKYLQSRTYVAPPPDPVENFFESKISPEEKSRLQKIVEFLNKVHTPMVTTPARPERREDAGSHACKWQISRGMIVCMGPSLR